MYERGRAAPTWHFVRPNGLEGGKFTLLHDVSRPIRELQESFMGVSQDRRAFAQGVTGASPTAREGQLCSQRQHPECMLDELTDIHEQKDKTKHASLTLSATSNRSRRYPQNLQTALTAVFVPVAITHVQMSGTPIMAHNP